MNHSFGVNPMRIPRLSANKWWVPPRYCHLTGVDPDVSSSNKDFDNILFNLKTSFHEMPGGILGIQDICCRTSRVVHGIIQQAWPFSTKDLLASWLEEKDSRVTFMSLIVPVPSSGGLSVYGKYFVELMSTFFKIYIPDQCLPQSEIREAASVIETLKHGDHLPIGLLYPFELVDIMKQLSIGLFIGFNETPRATFEDGVYRFHTNQCMR